MQESRPIAFVSKSLSIRNQSLSIYRKEFMAMLLAIQKTEALFTRDSFH